MNLLATATQYLYVPVTGPEGTDLTPFQVGVALIPESAGGEPQDADYRSATWENGEAKVLVTAGTYPAGEYLVFVRVQASPEDVRLFSGRLRIGDART